MAKKKSKKKEEGEQQELFELLGDDAKEIKTAGRLYKKHQKIRLEALKNEIAQKGIILELVDKAGLQRLEDGKIKFKVDGMEIEIEPRDDLVKVKEKAPKKEGS